MVSAMGFFACMDTIAKYRLARVPGAGIVWVRFGTNLVMLLVWFAARGNSGASPGAPGLQLARGLLLASATLLYFTSLNVLPLAEAAAIGFVLPLFVAVLAVPMLDERLDVRVVPRCWLGWPARYSSFARAREVFTPYALLPVGMALCNALYQVLTRKVAGNEHPLTSLVSGAIVGAVLLSAVAPFAGSNWIPPGTGRCSPSSASCAPRSGTTC